MEIIRYMDSLKNYLNLAKQAGNVAKNIIMDAYQSPISVEIKDDYTPVTEIDVNVEKSIRKMITEAYPNHGFWGEESGKSNIDSDYIWLIDPIDGTKAFIRGRPFFSCQIALMFKGEIILGVSVAPAFNGGEIACAAKGMGAFIGESRIHVSSISELKDVVFSSGNIKSLTKESIKWEKYGELLCSINTTRGFGDFLHYHYLASGKLDAVVESDVSILDVAALSIIVKEAGGCVTDFAGNSLSLMSKNIVATNGYLHDKILSFLK